MPFTFGVLCDENNIQIGKWNEIIKYNADRSEISVLKIVVLKKSFTRQSVRILSIAAGVGLLLLVSYQTRRP